MIRVEFNLEIVLNSPKKITQNLSFLHIIAATKVDTGKTVGKASL